MNNLSYRFIFGGQSNQLIRFLDAFDENLSTYLKDAGIEEADDIVANRSELKFEIKVTADAGISTAIIGLIFFVTGWAGDHILDELFEEKFKESIKRLISKARKNIRLNRTEPIEYRSIICRSAGHPTVVIRLSVETDHTLSDLMDSIKFAHLHAENWIANHGKKADIHCHTIVNGQYNIKPDLYSNIKDIAPKKRNVEVRDWTFPHPE
ncbi:hypothetical protein [Pseudomonas sp. OA65]|uniref:hypothetical protein n=1 Tax=Pseudomonas sp. OA65 TaxID=2818431 RepID=UPI001A9D54FE|nr:hypothetical protein [Pseudomonas sp. OA65]MBO1537856.1 hypothetical protein [Pseudomonas sp. OA65]